MFVQSKFISRILLLLLSSSTLLISGQAFANTCSRADVDFYLQRGFTTDQVTKLCDAAPTPVAQGQAYAPINPQNQQLRDDQIFLSTALDASNVKLTNEGLSYSAEECAVFEHHPIRREMDEEVCVKSNVNIKFAGLSIVDTQAGFFMVRDSVVVVKGDIDREYTNFNRIRRQDRSLVQQLMPNKPTTLRIKARRGIKPGQITEKLRPYIR